MMPETSIQILNDETFPGDFLMEFDELDDDISISPPGILVPENNLTTLGSHCSVTTSQTNSSSENYSLSTENENGSGSSNSTNIFIKYHPSSGKRMSLTQNAKKCFSKSFASSSSAGNPKRSKSEGNLLNTSGPQCRVGITRPQKYGHVKSKVKQYIDETLSQHVHHSFVRHKSMPVSTTEAGIQENTEIETVQDANVLRAMVKESSDEVSNLQRHLEFSEMLRKDDIAKIENLKRKIEIMRLEHSKREKERQRERDCEKELDRQLVLANYLRYSSQTSLNRVFASVGTQTSPETNISFNNITLYSDESFAGMLASNFISNPNTSTAPRAKRALLYAPDSHLEQNENINDMLSPCPAPDPQNSPDYLQLQPTATVSYQISEDSTEAPTELLIQDYSDFCNKCIRKKKKKSKKTRLASFFCIKKED